MFTADEPEQLIAVGFFQHPYQGRKEVFRLSVHLNPTGGPASVPFSPGNEVAQVTVESELGGYHSLALPHPVRLKAGQRFAVLLTGHDAAAEQNAAQLWVERKPYTNPFEAASGESYISRDGVTWFDLTTVPAIDHTTGAEELVFGNLAIKAYARSGWAALELQIGYQSSLGKLVQLKDWRPIGELKIAPLRVETTSPLPGATVPYPNPEITARFSRDTELGPGAGQVVIQSPGSTLPAQVAAQGPWLQIYPQDSLESPSLGGKVWTVIIPADAVTDSLGTSLTEAYSWSFFVIGVN